MSYVSEKLVTFLSSELGVARSRLGPETRLQQDLGVDGEDGKELLAALSRSFQIDLHGLQLSKYFGPETGPNPVVWLWWRLTFSKPMLVPIRLKDLQASLEMGRWREPEHAVSPASRHTSG